MPFAAWTPSQGVLAIATHRCACATRHDCNSKRLVQHPRLLVGHAPPELPVKALPAGTRYPYGAWHHATPVNAMAGEAAWGRGVRGACHRMGARGAVEGQDAKGGSLWARRCGASGRHAGTFHRGLATRINSTTKGLQYKHSNLRHGGIP